MKSIPSILAAGAMLALLTACGGGGGSTTTDATDVAISSSNQNTVARATVVSGLRIGQSSSAGASNPAAVQGRAGAQAVAIAGDQAARRALGVLSDGARAHAASASSIACAVSGTLTTTLANDDLSVGDAVTFTYDQCQETAGLTMNGSMAITITSLTDLTRFDASEVYDGFTIVQGALQTTMNGAMTFARTTAGTVTTDTLTIGAKGLAIGITSPNYSDVVTYASGTTIANATDATLDQTALTVNGSFTSSLLAGRVTLATLQPIVRPTGATFPTSGQVRVTGATGSALRITAINATQAELQLDANGDGTADGTVDVDWATLIPQ